jgi:hypothetical protein
MRPPPRPCSSISTCKGEVRALVGPDPFGLVVETAYPWHGEVTLRVVEAPPRALAMNLRVPGWCESARIAVNDEEPLQSQPGYVVAAAHLAPRRRQSSWRCRCRCARCRPTRAPPNCAAASRSSAAPSSTASNRRTRRRRSNSCSRRRAPRCRPAHEPALLAGVTVLRGDLLAAASEAWSGRQLYRPAPPPTTAASTWVPYAVWDNRAAGPMAVWVPQSAPGAAARRARDDRADRAVVPQRQLRPRRPARRRGTDAQRRHATAQLPLLGPRRRHRVDAVHVVAARSASPVAASTGSTTAATARAGCRRARACSTATATRGSRWCYRAPKACRSRSIAGARWSSRRWRRRRCGSK